LKIRAAHAALEHGLGVDDGAATRSSHAGGLQVTCPCDGLSQADDGLRKRPWAQAASASRVCDARSRRS